MPKIAAIVGPTASGKTGLAVALRRHGLPIEAIGCDALQVFSGLDAATAKPSAVERAELPYHLVDVIDPHERVDAGEWARRADHAIRDIGERGQLPVVVGGTGLYLRALIDGLAQMPAVAPDIRATLGARWDAGEHAQLYAELQGCDPVYATTTPPQNRQRVLRALEVYLASGTSFSAWHQRHRDLPPRYDACVVVLAPPRPQLHERLQARAVAMAAPLLEECRELLGAGLSEQHHASQAIGYRLALRMLREDSVDLPALEQALVVAHRQYAKRQRTWFARLPSQLVITAADASQAPVISEVAELFARFFGHLQPTGGAASVREDPSVRMPPAGEA